MSAEDELTILDCVKGIDESLARIADSLEEITCMLRETLDDEDGIIGKTASVYGGKRFIRILDIGD